MAAINRPKLISDAYTWLPSANTLNDCDLILLADAIISTVGDSSDNHGEVLCKLLKAAAIKNMSNSSVQGGVLKRQRIGEREEEYFKEGSTNFWKEYIDRLTDICPLFGYKPPANVGLKISPGKKISLCSSPAEVSENNEFFL